MTNSLLFCDLYHMCFYQWIAIFHLEDGLLQLVSTMKTQLLCYLKILLSMRTLEKIRGTIEAVKEYQQQQQRFLVRV